MKLALPLASIASLLVPTVAAACPAMASRSCGVSSLGGYIAAVSIGLLVGLGSVALEKRFRNRG